MAKVKKVWFYSLLPSGNTREFPTLDAACRRMHRKAQFHNLQGGGGVYRVLAPRNSHPVLWLTPRLAGHGMYRESMLDFVLKHGTGEWITLNTGR